MLYIFDLGNVIVDIDFRRVLGLSRKPILIVMFLNKKVQRQKVLCSLMIIMTILLISQYG